jgi:hypothetical protein
LNLGGLFGRKTERERAEDELEIEALHNAHGDAGPPAGQNAGDATMEEEDDAETDGGEGAARA